MKNTAITTHIPHQSLNVLIINLFVNEISADRKL